MNLDFNKTNGLIPAIIQDVQTSQVLMLGFMNQEALNKTKQIGLVTFWSRSKKRLWTKGESSGNKLKVVSITPDCDNDTLLIKATPQGPTCHTGSTSCFQDEFDIPQLFKLIENRKKLLPQNSYTTSLFKEGINKILSKVSEESEEVIQAATNESKQRLTEESCDLIYHLFVLLTQKNIKLSDLNQEFNSRRKK